MIEKLIIRNFQKHKKLEIEFDPHITTIIGASDKGKSAVIRALKWICTNKPNGDAFIRHTADSVCVRLYTDGRKIDRRREKGKINSYTLDNQEYHALGQGGIPEEIQQLLNVSTLNFQNQMDGPFWFLLTPGEVSRQINQIINLELIDKTLVDIASRLRKAKSTVTVCEERLEVTQKQVKELSWAVEADRDLQDLELLYNSLRDRTCRLDFCREIVFDVRILQHERDNSAQAKESGADVMVLAESLLNRDKKLKELRELVSDIEIQGDTLVETMKELKKLHKQMEKEMDGKCPLCKQTLKRESIWNAQ